MIRILLRVPPAFPSAPTSASDRRREGTVRTRRGFLGYSIGTAFGRRGLAVAGASSFTNRSANAMVLPECDASPRQLGALCTNSVGEPQVPRTADWSVCLLPEAERERSSEPDGDHAGLDRSVPHLLRLSQGRFASLGEGLLLPWTPTSGFGSGQTMQGIAFLEECGEAMVRISASGARRGPTRARVDHGDQGERLNDARSRDG